MRKVQGSKVQGSEGPWSGVTICGMAQINYGRVVLGTLAAGVVANVCDFVINTYLMAGDMQRMAQRLGLNPDVMASSSVATTWVLIDFIYAGLIVWTYAAIRPRLGPGPSTAICAAFVIYLSPTIILLGFQAMGIITFDTYLKSSILSLIVAILAGLTGGYVYKED